MEDYHQFTENPTRYLASLLQLAPSREAAGRLGGTVAGSIGDTASKVAALYVQAAARHLPATAFVTTTAAAAGAAANNIKGPEVELEMKNTQLVLEIVEAVGHAVTLCQPRSVIAQSGILPVLGNLMPAASTTSLTSPGPALAAVHVEFLQACIYAEQYAYAERSIRGTWPRPNASTSVRQVLRYFYLRGVVHLGCDQHALAVRCFRTCLCVPAEVVSAIAVAAWKKLVLVQCLLQVDQSANQTKPTTLPEPTPSCVSRYIQGAITESAAKAAKNSSRAAGGGSPASVAAPENASATILHLVDNLETGESTSSRERAPKYPSLGVAVYAAIVKAFVDMDIAASQQQLSAHERLLAADGNTGLAHQVAWALPRRQLVSWSRVYSSISLQALAQLLNVTVPDLSQLLIQVALAKEWPIQVSVDGHMVTFPRIGPQITMTSSSSADNTMEELVTLAKLVQKMDATLSASSRFASLARKESSSGVGGGDSSRGGGGAPPGPRGVEDI
eukprot:scaffold381_cov178-Amphora_coffeaeformis.AAC.26